MFFTIFTPFLVLYYVFFTRFHSLSTTVNLPRTLRRVFDHFQPHTPSSGRIFSLFLPFYLFLTISTRFHSFSIVSTRSRALRNVLKPYYAFPVRLAPISTIHTHFSTFSTLFGLFLLSFTRFWPYRRVLEPYVTSLNHTTRHWSYLRSLSTISAHFWLSPPTFTI